MRAVCDRSCSSSDIIEKHGCCVRVLGDLSLLPADVREAMEAAVVASRHNTRVTLNICMSYTHQREMTQSMELIQGALKQGIIVAEDVDATLMQASLYTGISATLASEAAATLRAAIATDVASLLPLHPSASFSAASSSSSPLSSSLIPSTPDLLIRTSGETRLSDFLCFQCSSGETQLSFSSALWPDFSIWNWGLIVLEFQRVAPAIQARRAHRLALETNLRNKRDADIVRKTIREENRKKRQQEMEQQRLQQKRKEQQEQEAIAIAAVAAVAEVVATTDFEEDDAEDDHHRIQLQLKGAARTPLSCSRSSSASSSSSSSSADDLSATISHRGVSGSGSTCTAFSSSSTSEDSSNSEDNLEVEGESDRDSPPSSAASSPASSSPPLSASPRPTTTTTTASDSPPLSSTPPLPRLGVQLRHPAGVRAYWNTGGVVESVLQRRFANDSPSNGLTTVPPPQKQQQRTPPPSEPLDEIDEMQLQARVRMYAAAREKRLHAFTQYARLHTTSLI